MAKAIDRILGVPGGPQKPQKPQVRHLQNAALGKDAELHKKILAAGYILPTNMRQTEVAKLFSVTPQALTQWSSKTKYQNPCPRNKDKSYNLPEVLRWYSERSEQSERSASSRTPDTDRFNKYRADQMQLRVETQKGLYMLRTEVEEREIEIASIFRRTLETLPASISAMLVGLTAKSIKSKLEEEVRRILMALSE